MQEKAYKNSPELPIISLLLLALFLLLLLLFMKPLQSREQYLFALFGITLSQHEFMCVRAYVICIAVIIVVAAAAAASAAVFFLPLLNSYML